MLVRLQSPEAFFRFLHGGGAPAQAHGRGAPVFDVPADTSHRTHDILDDIRAGKRTAQFLRKLEPRDGKHLVKPFQDRSRNALPIMFETAREIANEPFGLLGIIHFPGLSQDSSYRGVHRFWQPLQNVAGLVHLAALDRGMASESSPDRLGQRLRTIDYEETRHMGIAPRL